MSYAHRPTVSLNNGRLELTVLPGGGHIAAVRLLPGGVSPLWDPPWETIDPRRHDVTRHAEYGDDVDAQLLAGIVGHNLCFDVFGIPSEEEAAVGLGVHGEGSVADWDVTVDGLEMTCRAELPLAGMDFERRLTTRPDSSVVVISETAYNRTGVDRPVGWTQHVTLGPPFLEKGKTQFRASAGASKIFEGEFAAGYDRFVAGAEFQWPWAPLDDGGFEDLRTLTDRGASGAFTTHLMERGRSQAFFTAWSPSSRTALGYVWRRSDFPWLGIWEENGSRERAPWRGRTLTRGMEFGVSPFPETRREAIDRGSLFGERTYRWLPARGSVSVDYCLFLAECDRPPEAVVRRGGTISAPGLFEIT
ncbi:MAG: hypothetical protein GC160_16705 [Acidobacteria bacterium]|nr:hypothetical protein [Acidobacteriota bacterium]